MVASESPPFRRLRDAPLCGRATFCYPVTRLWTPGRSYLSVIVDAAAGARLQYFGVFT